MHIGHRVFIQKEAQTYLNPRVSHVPFFFASVNTPILKSSRKTMTVGTHRAAHEIKFHGSNGISICKQVPSRLKVVSGISSFCY
jgi:hypothetical protein